MGIASILARPRIPATDNFLPEYIRPAHDLCYQNHDILVELLRSGEVHGVFSHDFKFGNDAERTALEASGDIFEWFEKTGRLDERAETLKRTVFPALLSDFLHFIYEALATSRKGKLTGTPRSTDSSTGPDPGWRTNASRQASASRRPRTCRGCANPDRIRRVAGADAP